MLTEYVSHHECVTVDRNLAGFKFASRSSLTRTAIANLCICDCGAGRRVPLVQAVYVNSCQFCFPFLSRSFSCPHHYRIV